MFESKYLKDDIENIQHLLTIPALKNFETWDLAKLLRLSKIRQYDDGEVIIKEGELDNWFYFILSGKVRISKKGIDISTLNKESVLFGEMRLIDGLSRSASVYSVGKTICFAVDISSKHRLGSEDEAASLLLLLYKMVAEFISIRLRLSNEELIIAKREISRLKAAQLKMS
ncbi:MAG: cyclic nucleotide-binding domain-containing protein [Desulfobacterales bacterium]